MTGWAKGPDAEAGSFGPLPSNPRVVLRGLGWRMVASYLQELGAQLVSPADPGQARVQALLEGKGWQATLREHVEFVGALRLNRVEVRLSGEPAAVEQVMGALRRMALLESMPGPP
ncbi:MAG TPA: hypothetical protein VIL11_03655 [Limnochordales bacterium]